MLRMYESRKKILIRIFESFVIRMFLKIESAVTRSVGKRLHSAMIRVSCPVKDGSPYACARRFFRKRLPQQIRVRDLPGSPPRVSGDRRGFAVKRREHGSRVIINELSIHAAETPMNIQTRPYRRAKNTGAHSSLPALSPLLSCARVFAHTRKLTPRRLLPPCRLCV